MHALLYVCELGTMKTSMRRSTRDQVRARRSRREGCAYGVVQIECVEIVDCFFRMSRIRRFSSLPSPLNILNVSNLMSH